MSLTHSLTQSQILSIEDPDDNIVLGSDELGFGYPDPKDVPSNLDLYLIEKRQAKRFNSDRKVTLMQKAVDFVDVQDNITLINWKRKRTPWWFVTINPKPEVSVERLHNALVQVLGNSNISELLWCYEIRKAPDQGIHAHVLFKCLVTDNNFANRKIKQPLLDLVGNTKHICIKWVEDAELPKVRDYIKKNTVAKSKKQAHEATLAWRLKNEIPDELNEDHLLVWSESPDPDSNLSEMIALN